MPMPMYGLDPNSRMLETGLFGRREILTGVRDVTRENLPEVMMRAIGIHTLNAEEIEYLYAYMRGVHPVLSRTKTVRKEICNRVVENHAAPIAQFTSSYFMGEPVTYIRRGDREAAGEQIERLNEYMFYEDKASLDMDMANWMAVCGVGYMMVLPDRWYAGEPDDAPYELDAPDPRDTFVVYSTGFRHRPVMGVHRIWEEPEPGLFVPVWCGYTRTHYFEFVEGAVRRWEPHYLVDIPIVEFRLNMARMGSFEPALPLIDLLDDLMSNRADAVAQFVQSFLKFRNCDLGDDPDESLEQMKRLGAILLKSSANGLDADVEIMASELNQMQTQTMVDYIYDQILNICGIPSTSKANAGSTSDTGDAVFLRNGWSIAESKAKDTEKLFARSEKELLKVVLHIIRSTEEGFDLSLGEIECKFTRRQHDNLQSKVQALNGMLTAGIHPTIAIATSGLFNDPTDVAKQSADTLRKWDYTPMTFEEIREDVEA